MHPQPSFDLKHQLIQVSLAQHGLLTGQQLREHGHTRSTISTLVSKGELVRVRRGLYRSPFAAITHDQRLLAACLGRRGTVVSHRSAAALHRLSDPFDGVEITTTADIQPFEDELLHRTKVMLGRDVTSAGGIPCTDVSRTLCDLGDVVTRSRVEEALDRALSKRLTSIARLDWRLRQMPQKGLRGAAVLRSLLDQRRDGPACESVLETKVLSLLKQAGLPSPVRQHRIALSDGRAFRADFAYPQMSLIIEAQGFKWHSGRTRWRQDLIRSSELAAMGWRIIYLTWEDVTRHRRETIERLRRGVIPQLWD